MFDEDQMDLFNGNFNALDTLASEKAYAASLVGNSTFSMGMNGKVAAELSALTGTLCLACLANNDLTSMSLLTTIQLNAKTPTSAVAIVFGCTTSFDV